MTTRPQYLAGPRVVTLAIVRHADDHVRNGQFNSYIKHQGTKPGRLARNECNLDSAHGAARPSTKTANKIIMLECCG